MTVNLFPCDSKRGVANNIKQIFELFLQIFRHLRFLQHLDYNAGIKLVHDWFVFCLYFRCQHLDHNAGIKLVHVWFELCLYFRCQHLDHNAGIKLVHVWFVFCLYFLSGSKTGKVLVFKVSLFFCKHFSFLPMSNFDKNYPNFFFLASGSF